MTMRAATARPPRVVLVLAIALLGAASSCQRGESNGAMRAEDTAATQGAERELEGVGEACRTPEDCDSYLWCIDDRCQVPPSVIGEADASTPGVRFLDTDGREVASFHVEVATTPAEQRKGLMFRREMARDWGMLFVYDRERHLSFWMENTFIPLDMVFIDGDGRVVHVIEEVEPLTRTRRRSKRPARYVLELNAGSAERVGLERGMRIELDNVDAMYQPSR